MSLSHALTTAAGMAHRNESPLTMGNGEGQEGLQKLPRAQEAKAECPHGTNMLLSKSYSHLTQQDSLTGSSVFKSKSYRPHISSKFHSADEYI